MNFFEAAAAEVELFDHDIAGVVGFGHEQTGVVLLDALLVQPGFDAPAGAVAALENVAGLAETHLAFETELAGPEQKLQTEFVDREVGAGEGGVQFFAGDQF